jgi:hypothetical protein
LQKSICNLDAQQLTSATLPFITHFPEKNRFGTSIGLIEGVCITDANGQSKSTFLSDEELIVSVKLTAHSEQLSPLNVGFGLNHRFDHSGGTACLLSKV